jgi:hypothetical protein
MQADADTVILDRVFANLDVGSGVTVFEFSDEWWKAGDPWNQDPGGAAPNSSGVPYDGAANEEYWGIVDVLRTEKLSYDAVAAAYHAPLCLVSAHAGPDRYLPIGTTSTALDGSASSHTGPLAFEWSQTSGPTTATFSSSSAQQPVVDNLAAGNYTFNLTVTGSCGTSTDDVAVFVSDAANASPIAHAGPDQILAAGTTLAILDGSGSHDPDGGPAPLSYTWTQVAGPALAVSGTWEVSPLVAGMVDGESYIFELVVFDGLLASDPTSVRLSFDRVFADGFESGDLTAWSGARLADDPVKGGSS